jgi:hypothetical protein
MDDRKRSSAEATIEYQRALLRFESAFEACERLPRDDRLVLFKEIAVRLLQRLPNAASKEQKVVQVTGIEIKST